MGRVIRKPIANGDITTIELTRGYSAIIDSIDIDLVCDVSWQVVISSSNIPYAVSTKGKLHRVILGITDPRIEVDHKNTDTMDNRRLNLRVSTMTQNRRNKKSYRGSTSRFKGVSWHKDTNKWQSQISVNRKVIYLGCFSTEEEAAIAYNAAAIKHFGEFARLNLSEDRDNEAVRAA